MRRFTHTFLTFIFLFNVFFVQLFLPAYSADDTILTSYEVENRSELNKKRVLSESAYKVSAIYPQDTVSALSAGYPGYRGPGQLVVYMPRFGKTTGTNEFGKEAVVVDDTVVKLTGADSIIPNRGYVISGHGSAKKWITDNLKIGTKVRIDEKNDTIIAYTNVDSYIYHAKEKIAEVEEFIAEAKNTSGVSEKKAKYYLKRAKQDYKKATKSNDNMAITYSESSIQMSKIALTYALPYIHDELKGVWIRPTEKNLQEVQKTLDAMAQTGINTVFLETYFHGMTIFPSKTMKKYGFTTQNPIFTPFDPLLAYVNESQKRGIKIHVWFESFYVGNKHPSINPTSILMVKPAWANKNKSNYLSTGYVSHPVEHNGYFLDPANPEVIEFLTTLIGEITTTYKIDGVNLDYIRYPNSQKITSSGYEYSNWGYSEFARNEFMKINGVDPAQVKYNTGMWNKWDTYRQDKITSYIIAMQNVIPKKMTLSAVIFPDHKTCLQTKQQDWAKWSQEGYLDAITPLILTSDHELFYDMLKEIKAKTSSKTQIYPGLFIGFMEGEPEDLLKQINVARNLKAQGIALFDWAHLGDKYKDVLKFCVFTSSCK